MRKEASEFSCTIVPYIPKALPVNVPPGASLIEKPGAKFVCCSGSHTARCTFDPAGRQGRDLPQVTRIQQASATFSVGPHNKAPRAVNEGILDIGLYFVIICIALWVGPAVSCIAKESYITARFNVGHVHREFWHTIVGAASVHGIGAQVIRLLARGIDGAAGATQAL